MGTARIDFGSWLPDQPGLAGNLTEAKNVIPQAVGYGPLPSAATFSAAASENLRSLVAGKQPNGETKLFAAGTTKIYDVSSVGVLTDVSKSGGYTTATGDKFRFTQFGNSIIGTNNSEKLQVWTLGSSTAFADLSASAPIAKYITVVRDFVVVANTYESGNKPFRVRWSGLNDETSWTESTTTQADHQDIPDGGQIVGIRGGEFGLVLLERSIHRMSYVGAPYYFQFDNISRGKGCAAAGSIGQYQGLTFFLSDDGFYLCDGQTVTPIGAEQVDRWFYDTCDEGDFATMSSAVDPIRKLVMWNFKGKDDVRYLLIYNFATKKWSYGLAMTDYIAEASTANATVEGLDSISGSIDTMTTSWDSAVYLGGKFFLGGTSGAYVMVYNGASQTAEIITGDFDARGRSLITLARPQIDGGAANVSVASRDLLSDSLSYGDVVASDDDNRAPLRASGKYHRIKITPTGSWKTAIAVDLEVQAQGTR